MNLAIILVHNKTDNENLDQVDNINQYIIKQTETVVQIDEETKEAIFSEIYYYNLKTLPIDWKFKFYQVLPFGITPPKNWTNINSHKVEYGEKDEDKVGDHPRFFNWGVKRATDQGADIVIYITDSTQFNPTALQDAINTFIAKDYGEAPFGILTSNKIQQNLGQLDETKDLTTAIVDLKNKL